MYDKLKAIHGKDVHVSIDTGNSSLVVCGKLMLVPARTWHVDAHSSKLAPWRPPFAYVNFRARDVKDIRQLDSGMYIIKLYYPGGNKDES